MEPTPVMSCLVVARAHLRSWSRRLRGKPDTFADFARDLGFHTCDYTIRLTDDEADIDAQIDRVVTDMVRKLSPQIFHPDHDSP
jgi:hypothetical protein